MAEQTIMGAVRTTVKLTNAGDESMVSRGVLAPRHLCEYEGQALVDTVGDRYDLATGKFSIVT